MEVELVSDPSDARMAVVTTAIGSSQFDLGRDSFPVSQSQGVVFSTHSTRSFKFLEDTETYTLVMNRRKIAECCANLLALPIEDDIRFDTGFDLTTLSGQSWLRLMHYAEAELAHPQSFIRQVPAAWKQFEQTLMTGLLLAHRHDYSDALLRPQAPVAPYYVKRAEAFMEAHFSEPLSLADIAAYSQVSARSLQTGFQNFRNMTPMAFLRSTRLQHAHRALLLSDPATTTVTQIAMLCGFTHLGEFAASYRRAFGEPPSRTLLKATRR
jgi:AraC-like DNA-binding protein